ncbi:hypothetical protein GR158_01320 [Shinella sp. AETb1-6]|uniref:Uncharacterized protein n=2 Tax=Shinella TaxID=323620 RepID=A0AA50HE42_9HYPH|nr:MULTISPECIES: hypothetical protein [Shinella]MDP9589876.1 hypothetical protein [Shinella zoogloeoides]MCD1263712.1 hypothetical protein [Shinella sumterensis]MXN49741.1 hypothetical protein [Shinella sp. AETb1-6]TFE98040.1 hypothetical protein B5M44_12255 [Shinella sumterensis]UPA23362.1 hypothetical protein K6301_09135 [Shinella oryzae]
MNKTVTIALASLLAVSPVAGIAHAQSATTTETMTTGSISADNVSVVTLSSLENDSSSKGEYDRLNAKAQDAAAVAKTQDELRTDTALTDVLVSKNVQLENVIDVTTAANGGKIVYVK